MTVALATSTCSIEIKSLGRFPRLFAPAVKHGAKVFFENNSGTELTVDFNGNSPFPGGHFSVPSSKDVSRTISAAAVSKTYVFQMTTPTTIPQDLWLTVEAQGIERVGFAGNPQAPPGSNLEVTTQMWAPRGSLEIHFLNSTDDDVTLTISDASDPVVVKAHQSAKAGPFPFDLPRTVSLDSSSSRRAILDESGGTKLVDILPEGP